MKKQKFLYRRKLVKATTITMALLIAATLISSSAVSVTIGNEPETVIKDKVNENPENPQPLIVPTMETKIDFMSALNYNEQQQSANGNRAIEVIYDNNMDYSGGLGASQFDTVYNLDPVCADDFILIDPGNLTIEYVLWIGGYWNGDPGAFDWNVTIYEDDGSGYHPGNVIFTEVFANADTHETLISSGTSNYFEYWVELSTPLTVTVDTKYWVSCQGVGDFPPQSGFARHLTILNHQGNFKSVYFGFPNWMNTSDVFGDPSDFAFQLGKWAPIQDDLELVSINSPVSGDAGIFTPEVTVKNNANAQTNVPVQMTIGKITGVSVVPYYTEDFEASNGGYAVTGGLWEWGTPTYGPSGAYSGSYCWGTDLDYYYINMANAMLDSVPITIPVGATLNFWSWFYCENYYDGGNVKISTDGGSTFTILGSYLDPYNEDAAYSGNAGIPGEPCFSGSGQNFWQERTFDLGAYVGETAIIRWHFGSDSSVNSYPGWYVDDVSITYEEYTVDVEFDDTVYIDIGEVATEDVTFSAWMPDDWQVSENVDVDYFVHAETQLPGDEVPDNDAKDGAFTLNFPYLHDIAVTSINDPNSGDAQTLPVEITIKNVGQSPECCYLINTKIGQEDVFTYLFEDFEGTFPPAGWTVITNGIDTWHLNSYWGRPNNAGDGDCADADSDMGGPGMAGELWTPSMDLSTETMATLEFDASYNWIASGEWFDVDVSIDGGSNWVNLLHWEEDHSPSGPGEHVVIDLTSYCGNSNVIVRFLYDDFGIWAWWMQIDNVEVKGDIQVIPEYDEDIMTITLDPGQETDLTFPAWTPDALAGGLNGLIEYQVVAEQQLPGDTNAANDKLTKTIELDYRHDVGIQEITGPSDGGKGDIIFEQLPHDPDEGWSIGTSDLTLGYKMYENFWDLTDPIGDIHWWGLALYWTGSGWIAGNPANMEFDVGFYEDGIIPGAEVDYFADVTCTYVGTGLIYAGFEMQYWSCDDLGDSVSLSDGFVSIQSVQTTGDVFLWHSAKTGDGFSYQEGAAPPETIYDRAMQLTEGEGGGPGPPDVDIYIALGSQAIGAIVENLGTFGETGLTCYAEIYEFITNNTVGTLDWEANVTGIDLDPLGGEETLAFGSYGFADEGVYELILELPLGNDVDEGNNEETLGIGVDDTAPTSDHTVDPATPDGENGWYVSDVTVSFTATDALSGVDHIEYKVNGGSVQTGDSVTLTTDGTHDVEYRAVDNVGNTESWNSVDPIKIDQTVPTVVLTWESPDNVNVIFTADCSDATSGMDYVEFYLNNGLMFTAPAAPYEWTVVWSPGLKNAEFTAKGFDMAGLFATDMVTGIEAVPVPHGQTTPTPVTQQTNPL